MLKWNKRPSEKGKSWETVRRKAKGLNHFKWMAAGCHKEHSSKSMNLVLRFIFYWNQRTLFHEERWDNYDKKAL